MATHYCPECKQEYHCRAATIYSCGTPEVWPCPACGARGPGVAGRGTMRSAAQDQENPRISELVEQNQKPGLVRSCTKGG